MNAYENPYPGVNAHLNSLLQTPGIPEQPSVWPSFHSRHIAHIADALNDQLPPQYVAFAEQSLQTHELNIMGPVSLESPRPDVTIFQARESGQMHEGGAVTAPIWEVAIEEVTDPVDEPTAVIIRQVLDQQNLGRIVTRIELLSPSNKPGNSNYASYLTRRVKALESGVPLIEIDYLHEFPPVIRKLPVYPHDPEAYPYLVIVSDPRPNWHEGKVRGYGFRAGEPISDFIIPLAGDDRLTFDLNPVYHHTFRTGRWNTYLHYTAVPERFDTYRADDQVRIRAIMAKIKEGEGGQPQ